MDRGAIPCICSCTWECVNPELELDGTGLGVCLACGRARCVEEGRLGCDLLCGRSILTYFEYETMFVERKPLTKQPSALQVRPQRWKVWLRRRGTSGRRRSPRSLPCVAKRRDVITFERMFIHRGINTCDVERSLQGEHQRSVLSIFIL
jgi:hypothetical protein